MLFTLFCFALLLIVLAAIGLPLLSGANALPSRGQYDRAVYRDQLREVERDVARGVITQSEAEAARLEIQRRLLAADAGVPPEAEPAPDSTRSPKLAVASVLFVVLAAGGLYWRLGAPNLADVPYSARPAPEVAKSPAPHEAAAPHNDMQQAADRLAQKLAADPSNAGGWVLYARTLSMLSDWPGAADAYEHAMALGLKNADVLSGYGEMLVMAADGIVSKPARDSFAAAVSADSTNGVARYYLALADGQAGDERKAIDAWLELASGLPEDSPMRDEIGRRIADAAQAGGIAAPPLPKGLPSEAAAQGPTRDQMAEAAAMPAAEREQMISGMIEKLAGKLKAEPNDVDGWLRLGRAYFVQGQMDKAVDAYDHAASLKPSDPSIKLQTVAALLSGLKPADPLPPRAVTMLNEVASLAPDAPEVLWYLGVAAARAGHPGDARAKWTRLLASLPADGDDAKMVRSALGELKGP